jgi:orotidine-5'-phosphate decarboxylase
MTTKLTKRTEPGEFLCVALDVDLDRADELARKLRGKVGWVKIGHAACRRGGTAFIETLRGYGYSVFADMKLHADADRVQREVCTLAEDGVSMVTVHCVGGHSMLEGAMRGARTPDPDHRCIVIGITVLTSTEEGEMRAVGIRRSIDTQVEQLASIAFDAGLDGIICSAHESAELYQRYNPGEIVLVTPGIRPGWSSEPGDHKRVMTPYDAIRAGSDLLVVGRPITEADEPVRAVDDILSEIRNGLGHKRLP